MAWRQQDYVLRLIEQIGAAIRRAMGRRESGEPSAALKELEGATADLLGPAAELARHVDAQTAVNIIGDPQRLALWSRLLHAESQIAREMGDAERAEHLHARAEQVAAAAVEKDEGVRELLGEE